MDAMIRTEGLTKQYRNLTALDGVDLEVERGSIFGFIGPNGAGKTTFIRIVCTLLAPTSGEALIDGHSIRDEPDKVRYSIGYMPDFFGVYEDMKVWEYLDFFGRCYGVSPERRGKLIDELLDLVDLGHKKQDYVESLSRGMKQRLCLARTLVHEPPLLVLDEPASGLDPRARIEMRELVKELRRMGKTIFLSSHILAEMADMCTHIGIIEKGRLLTSGRVDDMISRLSVRKRVVVRVSAKGLTALRTLREYPGVADVGFAEDEPSDDSQPATLYAGMTDEIEDESALLTQLVQAGVPVRDFNAEKGDLEDIFMQVTKGEVQ